MRSTVDTASISEPRNRQSPSLRQPRGRSAAGPQAPCAGRPSHTAVPRHPRRQSASAGRHLPLASRDQSLPGTSWSANAMVGTSARSPCSSSRWRAGRRGSARRPRRDTRRARTRRSGTASRCRLSARHSSRSDRSAVLGIVAGRVLRNEPTIFGALVAVLAIAVRSWSHAGSAVIGAAAGRRCRAQGTSLFRPRRGEGGWMQNPTRDHPPGGSHGRLRGVR